MVNPDVFFEGILPLMGMAFACLVCIATPLDESNFFSKLKLLKDDEGDPLMTVISLTTVCSECKKLPEEKHKDCTHIDPNAQPPWKCDERYSRAKIYQKADPSVGRNARENMGLVVGDNKRALITDLVKRFFTYETRPYYEITRPPDRIYVMTDPDAGGASQLSIISGIVLRTENTCPVGTGVLLGIDFKNCKSDSDQEAAVKKHILTLREQPLFQNSKIIVVPENQTGYFHTRIENICRDVALGNCVTFHQGNGEKAGVRKDAHKTKEYVMRVNDMLEDNLLRFSTNWFTNSQEDALVNKTREGVVEMLKDQCVRYGYDKFGKLTGKIDGYEDDGYVAFAMFCYWSYIIEVFPYYEEYRKRIA